MGVCSSTHRRDEKYSGPIANAEVARLKQKMTLRIFMTFNAARRRRARTRQSKHVPRRAPIPPSLVGWSTRSSSSQNLSSLSVNPDSLSKRAARTVAKKDVMQVVIARVGVDVPDVLQGDGA